MMGAGKMMIIVNGSVNREIDMHLGAYIQGFIVWVCPRLSDRWVA
jgi:type IV secretory pathway TrbD component